MVFFVKRGRDRVVRALTLQALNSNPWHVHTEPELEANTSNPYKTGDRDSRIQYGLEDTDQSQKQERSCFKTRWKERNNS